MKGTHQTNSLWLACTSTGGHQPTNERRTLYNIKPALGRGSGAKMNWNDTAPYFVFFYFNKSWDTKDNVKKRKEENVGVFLTAYNVRKISGKILIFPIKNFWRIEGQILHDSERKYNRHEFEIKCKGIFSESSLSVISLELVYFIYGFVYLRLRKDWHGGKKQKEYRLRVSLLTEVMLNHLYVVYNNKA